MDVDYCAYTPIFKTVTNALRASGLSRPRRFPQWVGVGLPAPVALGKAGAVNGLFLVGAAVLGRLTRKAGGPLFVAMNICCYVSRGVWRDACSARLTAKGYVGGYINEKGLQVLAVSP